MAQFAYENAAGLKYAGGPLQVKEFTTDQIVYQNGLVILTTSGLVRPWPGTGKALGVAQFYAAAGEKVLVSIDPETLYEATRLGLGIPTIADVGKYVAMSQENPALSVGGIHSSMKLGTPTTTIAADTPVQVVRLSNNVTNINPATNKKCIVKMTTGLLEPYVDAV
jgi:hypothetical protein